MSKTKKRSRVVYAKPPQHPHADLDPNVQRNFDSIKTFRATLGVSTYRAYVEFEVGGNCVGLDSISMDIAYSVWEALPKDPTDSDYAVFDMVDPEGNVLTQDQCTEHDLEGLIVGIELVALRMKQPALASRPEGEVPDGR